MPCGSVVGGGPVVRVVAGHAREGFRFLVTGALQQLFGVSDDFHLFAGIGGAVVVLKVFESESGPIVCEAARSSGDVGLRLQVALVADGFGPIA